MYPIGRLAAPCPGEMRQEGAFALHSSSSCNTGFTFRLSFSCFNNKTLLKEGSGSRPGEIYFPCNLRCFRDSGKLPFDILMTSN